MQDINILELKSTWLVTGNQLIVQYFSYENRSYLIVRLVIQRLYYYTRKIEYYIIRQYNIHSIYLILGTINGLTLIL